MTSLFRTLRILSCNIRASTLLVLGLAVGMNGVSFFGQSLMYQPDSGGYIMPAYQIWESFHLQAVGLNRVPGYAVFLAPFLGVFETEAMAALAAAQHALLVLCTWFVVRIGDTFDESGWVGLIGGVLFALALQLQSYANMPMSEVLYAFLITWGLFLALQYLKRGPAALFIGAVLLFSVSTLVRPSAKLLPVLLCLVPLVCALVPHWSYLGALRGRPRLRSIVLAVAGALVTAAVLSPWAWLNYRTYGQFALTGTFGLNLYSNTVQFGGFWDEDSPAIADIQRRYEEGEQIRLAKGITPESGDSWRNHWPAMGRYLLATGVNEAEADQVFLQAAVDSIQKYPLTFLGYGFRTTVADLIHAEATYRYVSSLDIGQTPPGFMRHMLSIDTMRPAMEAIHDNVNRYGHARVNPVRFSEPTWLTPVYGALGTLYHQVMMRQGPLLSLFALGLGIVLWRSVRPGGLVWLGELAALSTLVLILGFIVPGSSRHRLPADPLLCVVFAQALVWLMDRVRAALRARLSGWSLLADPRTQKWLPGSLPIDHLRMILIGTGMVMLAGLWFVTGSALFGGMAVLLAVLFLL